MLTLLGIIHIIMAICIVALILVQDPKGGAMGVFGGGGGSQTVFGSSGGGDFLTKATRFLAIIFAITSISLAYLTSSGSGSVLDSVTAPASALPTSTINKAVDAAVTVKDKATDAAADATKSAGDTLKATAEKAAGAVTGTVERAKDTAKDAAEDLKK